MRTVIDSSAWLEYFTNGKLASKCASFIESANEVDFFTPTIVLFEVYKKVKREKGREAAVQVAAQISGKTTLIQLTDVIAIQAAELSIMHNLKIADAIIKATTDELDAVLVTCDSDFKGLTGVNLVQ